MGGAVVMVAILCIIFGVTLYLVGTLARSIQHEKRASMKLWKNFGVSPRILRIVSVELDRTGGCRMAESSPINNGNTVKRRRSATSLGSSLNRPSKIGNPSSCSCSPSL
jgi:hypothetical protein